jgi:triosephosphate isomerase
MRKPVFAGNWKMYKTPAEAAGFLHDFAPLVAESSHAEIVVCPPFIDIALSVEAARGTNVAIGAQDLSG